MPFGREMFMKVFMLVLFALIIAAGIFRDEIPDVISNATLICFSCIGLK